MFLFHSFLFLFHGGGGAKSSCKSRRESIIGCLCCFCCFGTFLLPALSVSFELFFFLRFGLILPVKSFLQCLLLSSLYICAPHLYTLASFAIQILNLSPLFLSSRPFVQALPFIHSLIPSWCLLGTSHRTAKEAES